MNPTSACVEGKNHRTGRSFVGCFVGDHVKFAIETRLMTGACIGTGAMVATTQPAPSPTPRFAWLTDSGARTFQMNKFLDVACRVMARRGVELDTATEEVLRQLAG